MPIRNRNRCVGGILSSHIARQRGADGLPEDSIVVDFEGSAGQSFAGWLAPGVTFTLRGDANDYAGKGLSGGVFAIRPRDGMGEHFKAEQNVIVGNTVLYGATGGRAFFRGLAGERFAVRNSGAWAVVEGVGDHGCEYMTGGRVVVLGPTGRNFAAGMSGGVAYVLDEQRAFPARCNMGMVGFEALSAADAIELRTMIEEHEQRTDSPVAARVLAEWETLLADGAFVKVMPHDYKRVLRELAEEEALAASAAENGGVAVTRKLRPGRRDGSLMGKLGGFLQIERHGIPQRDPVERAHDYREFQLQRPVQELREQGARCMDCGVPFCHNGCPLGNLIPDWNDLVYRDRFKDAIAQLHATNNFPEFTGRLCPAPCEAACVLEIREGDAVTIKQIENSIINRAWEEGWVAPQPPSAKRETGQCGGRGRLRPGGHGGRPAAAPGGPPRDAVRARRGDRRARALRRAGLQDREDGRRAPRRAAGRRGRRAALRRGRRTRRGRR